MRLIYAQLDCRIYKNTHAQTSTVCRALVELGRY